MRLILIITIAFGVNHLSGQSFILNQFFQPSLSVNGEYAHDFNRLGDRWDMGRLNANLIIPVKSKLGLEMDWKKLLNAKSFKDLGKVAELKAYQIFWTFRPQVTYLRYRPEGPKTSPFADSLHFAYGLQTGVTGLHLIKKMRLFFYTINIGAQEDLHSLGKLRPYGNVILGVVNFNKVMYYWYYGVSISASDGQIWPVLPVPFFGVDLHLAKKLWWNITLPIQTRFEWKTSRFVKFDAVASLATYGWGFGQPMPGGDYQRHYASGFQFRTGLAINLKNKRGTKFYLEGGYMPFRSFGFDTGRKLRPLDNPNLQPSPYVSFSLFYGFKKSLLGSTVENFLNF